MTLKRKSTRASGKPSQANIPSLRALPTGSIPTSLATAQLQVRENGVLLLLDGTESSWIDLRDPTHLDFEYQQQMDAVLGALLPLPTPVRALHLGGGGCALARAWDAARVGSRQLAIEIDAVLATLVRQWFDLPHAPQLRIRVGDAAQIVTTLRAQQWDVIVRDVFNAGNVPETCANAQFHANCRRLLAPQGIYLANLSSLPRRSAGADLTALATVFAGVLVVADPAYARGKRRGNLVAVARKQPWEEKEIARIERAVRRLMLPVRTWRIGDPALPH